MSSVFLFLFIYEILCVYRMANQNDIAKVFMIFPLRVIKMYRIFLRHLLSSHIVQDANILHSYLILQEKFQEFIAKLTKIAITIKFNARMF